MAQEPLATKGNFLHIYDFRVAAGHEDEFIRLFEQFDYSDGNPMHKSAAQVKDGVLCRDTEDPQASLRTEVAKHEDAGVARRAQRDKMCDGAIRKPTQLG